MKRAFLGFDDKLIQSWMLLDGVRNDAFQRAIRETVRPGDVVVDIGTGTGLLAIWAARAGAKKVYAIERGAIAELATKVIRDSGVQEVVEILRGDFRDVTLPAVPDVIVSETLGDFGLDEGISETLRLVHRRHGAVRTIPGRLRIEVFAAENRVFGEELTAMGAIDGVNLSALLERVVSSPLLRKVTSEECLTRPEVAAELNLSTDIPPKTYDVELRVERDGELSLLAAAFTSQLSESVSLSTLPGHPETCWRHLCFPIWPALQVTQGEKLHVRLEPRTTGFGSLWRWSVRGESGEREGDTLRSSGGGLSDYAAQLGMTVTRGTRESSVDWRMWASLFEGDPGVSLELMTARLLRDFPERFADEEDARAEVVRRLIGAGALL